MSFATNYNEGNLTSREANIVRKFVGEYYGIEWCVPSNAELRVFIAYMKIAKIPFDVIDLLIKGNR